MRKRISIVLALGCCIAIVECKKQVAASPWVGAWTLDLSRSKLNEAPKQETMQIDAADPSAIRYTVRGTGGDGKQYVETYDGKPDGSAYPVTVDGRELGKIAFHWKSDHVCMAEGKGLGGSTLTETATVSDDGKTLTIKSREGKEEEETAIYTK